MRVDFTVYMDKRPITKFVKRLRVQQQSRCLYRSFELDLAGWSSVEVASSFDVYASHNPAVPRAEIVIAGGMQAPEQKPKVVVDGGVPTTTVVGYDWAWFAQRLKAPGFTTVVVAKSAGDARRAVLKSATPLGRWQWLPAATLHAAVQGLGGLAGFSVELRMPDYPFSWVIIKPEASLWQAILDLVAPYAPEIYFRRTENRVLITDRVSRYQTAGTKIVLAEGALQNPGGVEVIPELMRYRRRVLLSVPRWL